MPDALNIPFNHEKGDEEDEVDEEYNIKELDIELTRKKKDNIRRK